MAYAAALSKAREYMANARARIERAKEKTEAVMQETFSYAEVGGFAFMSGYANSRWSDDGVELVIPGTKVPVDATAGVALAVAAFFGIGGKYNEHIHSGAKGLLAGVGYRYGAQFGAKARTTATNSTAGLPEGYQSWQAQNAGRSQAGIPRYG